MLEIIAIIFLSRKIGDIAERKGLKRGMWVFFAVIAWIVAEIFGVVIGIILFGEDGMFPAILLGYGLAVASYFTLKAVLNRKPDIEQPSFEFEAQHENPQNN